MEPDTTIPMKEFPDVPRSWLESCLKPVSSRPCRIVLDTDTDNEIDDQFAVVQCLLSPEDLSVERIYAAPYFNERSTGPADGLRKSHAEILRLLKRFPGVSPEIALPGSDRYLEDRRRPVESEAARDLVARGMEASAEDPLTVVAIGAITNVASALLMEPRLVNRIRIVWLGGQPLHFHHVWEFNLSQDIVAAQVIFDCGAPLVLSPCAGVAELLRTTLPEIREHLAGRGPLGDYLHATYQACAEDHFGYSRVIWDISAPGWILTPNAVPTHLHPSPVVLPDRTWAPADPRRHPIAVAWSVHRDTIFRDLFGKVAGSAGRQKVG